MPNFFSIKDGWNLDEQLGSMLRELDESLETTRRGAFEAQLRVLLQEYEACGISDATVIEWIREGILRDFKARYQ